MLAGPKYPREREKYDRSHRKIVRHSSVSIPRPLEKFCETKLLIANFIRIARHFECLFNLTLRISDVFFPEISNPATKLKSRTARERERSRVKISRYEMFRLKFVGEQGAAEIICAKSDFVIYITNFRKLSHI